MAYYLITFAGCPLVPKAQALLAEFGIVYQESKQDELPEAHPHRAYTSPSLLAGDRLIFGSPTGMGARGCTVTLPTAAELKRALGI